MTRKPKLRYFCRGIELFDTQPYVTRCKADATVIAHVRLVDELKELCDECLTRYRAVGLVIRTLVVLAPGTRK